MSQQADNADGKSRGRVIPLSRQRVRRTFRFTRNQRRGTRGCFAESSEVDAALNAAWDRLRALTEEALLWRDPESIAAVKTALRHVEQKTLQDWYR